MCVLSVLCSTCSAGVFLVVHYTDGGAFASRCVTRSVWTSCPCSSVPLILPIQPPLQQSWHISQDHFFLNRTSQVGGNVPNRAGCHCPDTTAAAEGPARAMPEILWIFHPFCLSIFCIPCHCILSILCILCSCTHVTLPGTAACAITWFASCWQGLMHI